MENLQTNNKFSHNEKKSIKIIGIFMKSMILFFTFKTIFSIMNNKRITEICKGKLN